MDWLKWVVVAIIGLLAFNWLRRGLSANASLTAQATSPYLSYNSPVYGGMSSWTGPYLYGGQVPAWMVQQPWYQKPYNPPTPINVSYSPDDGIDFQYGY